MRFSIFHTFLINRKSCVLKSIRFGTERFESLSFQLLNALRLFLSLYFQRVFLEVFIFNRLADFNYRRKRIKGFTFCTKLYMYWSKLAPFRARICSQDFVTTVWLALLL